MPRISSKRAGWWFAFGVACGGGVVAIAVAVWTFVPTVCTTVGYENRAPIELEFHAELGDSAEVAACFDMNCTAMTLPADDDGTYAVPQEAPFLSVGENLPVSTTGVRVTVSDGGRVVVDNRFGISTVSEAPVWSRCPGPFQYAPVKVSG